MVLKSELVPVLGVRDLRVRSVGPTFNEDLRKSLLGNLEGPGLKELGEGDLKGDSALGPMGGFLGLRLSTDDCRDFSLPTRGGESFDFVVVVAVLVVLQGLLLEVVESSRRLSVAEREFDFEVVEMGLLLL